MNPPDENTQIAPIPSENSSSDTEKAIALMGGSSGPEDLPGADSIDLGLTAPTNKILPPGTMVIITIIILAAGSLYGMRISQHEITSTKAAQATEAKIDQVLAKLSQAKNQHNNPLNPASIQSLFHDADGIVAMFASDMTQQQVPLEYVKKNPFLLSVIAQQKGHQNDTQDDEATKAARLLQQLEGEFNKMELQSVMKGKRPVAIIDGELVQPGQTIGNFTVLDIQGLAVLLESNHHKFVLEMGKDKSKPKRRR